MGHPSYAKELLRRTGRAEGIFYRVEIPRFARSDDKPLPVIARRSRGNPIWILIKGRGIHKKEEKQNG
jgi:hypothetical protein